MSTQISDKIEGVPDGWRLVAFRAPRQGEYYISAYTGEVLELNHGGPFCSVAIVVPDNVYGVRHPLKDVLAPHGYKAIAFRVPRESDTAWITRSGSIANIQTCGLDPPAEPHVIIEPLPPPPKPKLKVLVAELGIGYGISEEAASQRVKDHPSPRSPWDWAYRIEERDA